MGGLGQQSPQDMTMSTLNTMSDPVKLAGGGKKPPDAPAIKKPAAGAAPSSMLVHTGPQLQEQFAIGGVDPGGMGGGTSGLNPQVMQALLALIQRGGG